MEFEHVPSRMAPRPLDRASLLSPAVTANLDLTPEKEGSRETFLLQKNHSNASFSIKSENLLSQPQINTTALLAKKLDILKQSKFNRTSMIKQELDKSNRLRQDIAEKASEALNFNPRQSNYPGLVSLDVSASDIALQQRKIFKEQKSEVVDEPDIMSFMSGNLQYENASLSCFCKSETSDADLQFFTASAENVFKLYELVEGWKR